MKNPPPPAASDGKPRCRWVAGGNALYYRYHDTEWGVAVHNDRTHFEFLLLEGAQAGLSWATVLNKRENYRLAFCGFNPLKIAKFGKREEKQLLANPGIIRNRLKIAAAITNARAFNAIAAEFGSFDKYVWQFAPKKRHTLRRGLPPDTTPDAHRLSKDLKKRGFKFVGATIIYAYMQAVGLVNDHEKKCFRSRELAAENPP